MKKKCLAMLLAAVLAVSLLPGTARAADISESGVCGEDLTVDDEALAAGVVECPACGGKFALSFEDGDNAGQDE